LSTPLREIPVPATSALRAVAGTPPALIVTFPLVTAKFVEPNDAIPLADVEAS